MTDVKMTARQIAESLNRRGGWTKPTKRTSQGYMGLCPNHDDKNPSLSVRETEAGRIMLKCFAPTCTDTRSVFDAVEGALSLEQGSLGGPGDGYQAPIRTDAVKSVRKDFEPIVPAPDDAPRFDIGSRRFRAKSHGLPVKSWVYRNEHGRPMGYVARYERPGENEGDPVDKMIWPWTFGLREGRREWCVGAMPEPRVPYNLPAILANPDAVIQWHEGEKACDAGTLLFPDWIPTTTVGGGSAPHLTDVSWFRGRTVVLCPDMDLAGLEYALQVSEMLKTAGARVRILRFPTTHVVNDGVLVKGLYVMNDGDDADDHVKRGWTVDHIRTAVRESGLPLTWAIDLWEDAIASEQG